MPRVPPWVAQAGESARPERDFNYFVGGTYAGTLLRIGGMDMR
jgi:hypothetical protein